MNLHDEVVKIKDEEQSLIRDQLDGLDVYARGQPHPSRCEVILKYNRDYV